MSMEWYPTPSYLLKRQVILEFVRGRQFRRFLEVGCGGGDLLGVLERLGLEGVGIDISGDAVDFARQRLHLSRVEVLCKSVENIEETFDLVVASEVLEHHKDDMDFLRRLRDRLRPDGWLVLTVPAHMSLWGSNDEFCGHVRRYERRELEGKLALAGYCDILIRSYGFPLANIMKPFYDRAIEKRESEGEDSRQRTMKSGAMHLVPAMAWLFRLLFNDLTLSPFYHLQRAFYSSDRGIGYFIAARRC